MIPEIFLFKSSQRPRRRLPSVCVLVLLFFMARSEAIQSSGLCQSQSESFKPDRIQVSALAAQHH